MSKNSVNLYPSTLSSINKKDVEEDNRNCLYPCPKCVICGTFGIVTSKLDIPTLISANKEQNNQYTCIHTSLCSKHLADEKEIPEGTEVE